MENYGLVWLFPHTKPVGSENGASQSPGCSCLAVVCKAWRAWTDMRSQHMKSLQTSPSNPQHAIAHNLEVALWQRHKWPVVIFAAAHHHGFWRGGTYRGTGLEGKEPTTDADEEYAFQSRCSEFDEFSNLSCLICRRGLSAF